MFAQIKKLLGMGVDPGQIARPSGVSRRDFMKALGVTGVSVSMGGILLPYKQVLAADMTDIRFVFVAATMACPYAAEKQVIDAVNEFTRTKLREDGFYRRILPPVTIRNAELDRGVVAVPRVHLEENPYIRGPRYSPFREQMRRQNGGPELTPAFAQIIHPDEAQEINAALLEEFAKPRSLCNCGEHTHLDGSQDKVDDDSFIL